MRTSEGFAYDSARQRRFESFRNTRATRNFFAKCAIPSEHRSEAASCRRQFRKRSPLFTRVHASNNEGARPEGNLSPAVGLGARLGKSNPVAP